MVVCNFNQKCQTLIRESPSECHYAGLEPFSPPFVTELGTLLMLTPIRNWGHFDT